MILVCRDDTSLTFRIVHVRSVENEDTDKAAEGEGDEGASGARGVIQEAAMEYKYRSIILNSEDEDHTQTTMTNPNVDTGQLREPAEAIYMIKVQNGTNATIYMVSVGEKKRKVDKKIWSVDANALLGFSGNCWGNMKLI